jgi:rRNA-processing protein FCF1
MMVFQFGLRLEDELNRVVMRSYEILVASSVIDELKKICQNPNVSGEDRRSARSALALAEKYTAVDSAELAPNKKGDDALIGVAIALKEQNRVLVVTNDRQLRRRLAEHGIATAYLRAKKKLEVSGYF